MTTEEIPPWLREQLARFDQLQKNLQAILYQKQQVELELTEIEKALEELKKIGPDDAIFKSAGSLLVKVKKDDIVKELEEKRELTNTRSIVLTRQESHIRENVKEMQSKIDQAIHGRTQPPEN